MGMMQRPACSLGVELAGTAGTSVGGSIVGTAGLGQVDVLAPVVVATCSRNSHKRMQFGNRTIR